MSNLRVHQCNDAPVNARGAFVLYWMTAHRRALWNFSFERAVQWAKELNKPLLILEALRSGYEWASDRLHRFILDGMADNARHLKRYPVTYYAYVEPEHGEGKGLVWPLAFFIVSAAAMAVWWGGRGYWSVGQCLSSSISASSAAT